MSEYKALIFDLGQVIFHANWDLTYKYFADLSCSSFKAIKTYFEDGKYFNAFERGDIEEKDFRSITNEKLGINLSDEKFDKGLTALYLKEYEGVNSLLKNLKKSYRIIALSNTNIIHKRVWSVKYEDTMGQFERIFCSHEMNTRKPEEEPYNIALDYLDLKPEEVIFLDDKVENIEPAKTIGIKTILVESPAQMRFELKQLGII